jgi:rubrerythrin
MEIHSQYKITTKKQHKRRTLMNIFEYAMQMEKDGEKYYREIAAKCHAPGFERILNWMAEDEVKHYNILSKLNERVKHPELLETDILNNTKNVFQQMRDENETPQCPPTEMELYRKALEIELKSQQFYLDEAGKTENHPQKEVLLHIAKEEGKHVRILQNLVDFVASPETWLEDAEWYHLDAY